MFEQLFDGPRFLGFTLTRGKHFFFFGSRFVTREDLFQLFPQYEFRFLKQIHSRKVVESSVARPLPEADAHFTNQPGVALIAQSADCVPILLASPTHVCAIHAGWRGVAQNIVAAVHETLPLFKPDFAAIGPHIGQLSFEVGDDVAQTLRAASPSPIPSLTTASVEGKVFFDLKSLVYKQLRTSFNAALPIEDCAEDTKTSARFHSFRRDGAKAGRQYSFVVLNR